MWVELNVAEQRLATYLANARYAISRKDSLTNAKIGPQSNELTDLEGIGGELAFCKLMNIYPDIQLGDRPLADATLWNGLRVDIKTTVYKDGSLLAAHWKDGVGVDLYALMVGKFPRYRLAGLMDSKELLKPERLKDFGYGQSYAAAQSELSMVKCKGFT